MKVLVNGWYVAATSPEVTEQPLTRTILNEELVIFRGEQGDGIALGNICPHRYAKLGKGRVFGNTIECPYHGLRFGKDGECAHNPHGDGEIPPAGRVNAYPFIERDGFFWIWMGDRTKANAEDIPDFSILVDENYGSVAGYLKVEANYQLIVDNLMDLSHIQFLHPYLSDSDWLNKRTVEVDMEGHSVICKNRAKDMKIPPINKFIKPDALPIGETRLDMKWNPPSNLLLDVRYTTTQDDFHHPIGHIVTPETQSTTHYFFKASRNHRINDGELSHTLRGMFLRAFAEEDQPIIEDQQQSLGSRDLLETKAISLQTDVAALRVRHTLSKLIDAEAAEGRPLRR